jgi:heat shock protein HtpX/STE24 endopeptidase
MRRRPDRGLIALLPPLIAFVVFGALRVVAPVTIVGLVFDDPVHFAIVGVVLGLGGAGLLFVRPVETRVAALIAPSRPPTDAERGRVEPLLRRIGERAGVKVDRLVVGVEDDGELNASAGAAHLVFVTTAALRRSDAELEALLAHELGHHRGLHPVATALLWWLSLPGVALVAVYGALRRVVDRFTRRLPPVALVARVLLTVWQISVMWLYFIAQLLALRAARLSEFAADRSAARWGYGDALAALLTSLGPSEPAGLIARVMDSHPPTETRVSRLEEMRAGQAVEPASGY